MHVTVPSEGYTVEYLVDSIRVTIPGRKEKGQLGWLGAWLVFWLFGLAGIGYLFSIVWPNTFAGERVNFVLLFVLMLLVFSLLYWVLTRLLALYAFFWQIAGVEVVEISPRQLIVRKAIFGIGRTETYRREEISGVTVRRPRTLPLVFSQIRGTMVEVPVIGPVLVHLTERRVVYIGLGLEKEQGEAVGQLIQQQIFPNRALS